MPEVIAAVRAASVGELAWQDAAGERRVRGVVPLSTGAGPALAFPYADAALARSIGQAASVLLTLTEPRGTGTGWRPLALRCTPRLTEDRAGDRFVAELLDQELRKYPPARALADSVLLRREHWWWLPRLIIDLSVTTADPIASRATREDHLLVADDGARVVRAVPTPDGSVAVQAEDVPPGSVLVFGQDLSFPDLERWGQWCWHGEWDGAAFHATLRPDRVGLPPSPGLLERWRRQRRLERGCRAALHADPS